MEPKGHPRGTQRASRGTQRVSPWNPKDIPDLDNHKTINLSFSGFSYLFIQNTPKSKSKSKCFYFFWLRRSTVKIFVVSLHAPNQHTVVCGAQTGLRRGGSKYGARIYGKDSSWDTEEEDPNKSAPSHKNCTCVSHVKSWQPWTISVKTCEILHVKFHMWISNVNFIIMWKVKSKISHVKSHVKFHMQNFHMWKNHMWNTLVLRFACGFRTSHHVNHMWSTWKLFVRSGTYMYVGRYLYVFFGMGL